MENNQALFDSLIAEALQTGATNASIIPVSAVEKDASFRSLCASNACGVYGKCWMCPPDVGEIEDLMRELEEYSHAFVYQTIYPLEDSYDFEGMTEAKKQHYKLTQKIRSLFDQHTDIQALHLGAGGCGVCERCSKRDNEPCRFPSLAIPSLEAYGVNVSKLAPAAGMKYINGQNTVTYFGAVFFRD